MQLNGDIDWIRQELLKVKDPALIRVFKNLLEYRQKKEGDVALKYYNQELEDAEARILKEDFLDNEDVERDAELW